MKLKNLFLARLIDNFVAHYISYLNLKHAYKKWCEFTKKMKI